MSQRITRRRPDRPGRRWRCKRRRSQLGRVLTGLPNHVTTAGIAVIKTDAGGYEF